MKYIRVYEVLDVSELSMIKLSLRREDVTFRVQHEHTLQLSNAYSMGRTGALVEVLEEDVPLAVKTLEEMGIEVGGDPNKDRFKILDIADQIIDNIPGLRIVEGSLRYFFFFVLVAVVVFLGLITFLLKQQ